MKVGSPKNAKIFLRESFNASVIAPRTYQLIRKVNENVSIEFKS